MAVSLKFMTSFDGSSVKKGLDAAEAGVDKLGRAMRDMAESAVDNLKSMSAKDVITDIAGAFGAATDMASEIKQQAAMYGVSIEKLQELKFVAEQGGGTVEELGDAMVTLAERSIEAQGGSEDMIAAFQRMGISLNELKGMTPDELFMRVGAAARSAGKDSQFFKDAQDLLGTSKDVLPMMAQDMDTLIAKAHEYGLVLSGGSVEALDQTGKAIAIWKQQWENNKAEAAGFFATGGIGLSGLWEGATVGGSAAIDALWNLENPFSAFVNAGSDQMIEFSKEIQGVTSQEAARLAEIEKRKKEAAEAERKRLEAIEEQKKKWAEDRKKRADALKAVNDKINAIERESLSPMEKRKKLEEDYLAAKKKEEALLAKTAKARGGQTGVLGGAIGFASTVLGGFGIGGGSAADPQKQAEATLARMEAEKALKGGSDGFAVGQDQLSRMGLFRGAETEAALVQKQQLAALKGINMATGKITRNTNALQAP